MTTTNSALWDAASAESADPPRIDIPPVPSAVEGSEQREPRDPSPFESEEPAKGEEKSNRDNPTFKNRRNPMEMKQKTFSNRDKNTCGNYPLTTSKTLW
jgi:hypothetical protein